LTASAPSRAQSTGSSGECIGPPGRYRAAQHQTVRAVSPFVLDEPTFVALLRGSFQNMEFLRRIEKICSWSAGLDSRPPVTRRRLGRVRHTRARRGWVDRQRPEPVSRSCSRAGSGVATSPGECRTPGGDHGRLGAAGRGPPCPASRFRPGRHCAIQRPAAAATDPSSGQFMDRPAPARCRRFRRPGGHPGRRRRGDQWTGSGDQQVTGHERGGGGVPAGDTLSRRAECRADRRLSWLHSSPPPCWRAAAGSAAARAHPSPPGRRPDRGPSAPTPHADTKQASSEAAATAAIGWLVGLTRPCCPDRCRGAEVVAPAHGEKPCDRPTRSCPATAPAMPPARDSALRGLSEEPLRGRSGSAASRP
jgi:hypothetical protein